MIALLMLFAAEWSPPSQPTTVELRGGYALRVSEPDALSVDGQIVPLLREGTAWLLPASGLSRVVDVRDGAVVQTLDTRSETVALARAERAAAARPRGGRNQAAELPVSLVASLAARARLFANPRLVRLGVMHDFAAHRPLHSEGFATKPSQTRQFERVLSERVVGPAVVSIGLRPASERFERFVSSVALDGQIVRRAEERGAVSATFERVWVPPGDHLLTLSTDTELVAEWTVHRSKDWAFLPRAGVGRTSPLHEAERAYLEGRCEDAVAGFLPYRIDADPDIRTLASARLLRCSPEPAESWAAYEPGASDDVQRVLADAVWARADAIPDRILLGWLARFPDLDPLHLASWADQTVGLRPGGSGWLHDLAGPVPSERSLLYDTVRYDTDRLSFHRLPPPPGARPAPIRVAEQGLGAPRVVLTAGQERELVVNTRHGELGAVFVAELRPGSALALDGTTYAAHETTSLRIGLPPGTHTAAALRGEVLLSETLLAEPAEPTAFVSRPSRLPLTLDVPDPTAPAWVRIRLDTVDGTPLPEVVLVADDGMVVRLPASEESGADHLVRVGRWASGITLEGPDHVGVSAWVRAKGERGAAPLDPEGTVVDGLVDLWETTSRIDGGEDEARVLRAAWLSVLGERRLARADLRAALNSDAWALAMSADASLDNTPVTTRIRGALDPETGGTIQGSQAIRTGWEHTGSGNLLAALEAIAEEEGVQEEALLQLLLGRTKWRAVGQLDSGAGLTPVEVLPELEPGLAEEVRQALLSPPWPREETARIRGETVDRASFVGRQVSVFVHCRDRTLQARTCKVPLLVDESRSTLEVSDGAMVEHELRLRAGEHVVEVGPGSSNAEVAVRVVVDGKVVPPATRRLAFAVRGASKVALAPDQLIRLTVVRGDVEWVLPETAVSLGPNVAFLGPGESSQVVLKGSGAVLLASGVPEVPEPRVELGGRYSIESPPLPREMAERIPPNGAPLEAIEPGGTWEIEGSFHSVRDGRTRDLWQAAEGQVAWMNGSRPGWLRLEGWGRGPGAAVGGGLELGRRLGTGFARIQAEAGGMLEGRGQSAIARGLLRQDLDVGPRLLLRAQLFGQAGWYSLLPLEATEPRGWTLYRFTHSNVGALWGSGVWRPTRDTRMELGVGVDGNRDATMDRLQGRLAASGLLASDLVVTGVVTARYGFADRHRLENRFTVPATLRFDLSPWLSSRRRLTLWGEGTTALLGKRLTGSAGVKVLLARNRDLRDLPPTAEAFRTLRGVGP